MSNELTINPVSNGSQRENLLECGCDPANAEKDDNGRSKILATRTNPTAFESLDLDIQLAWTYCCQCKEVFKIEAIATAPTPHPIRLF